jgi:hypothetical protein
MLRLFVLPDGYVGVLLDRMRCCDESCPRAVNSSAIRTARTNPGQYPAPVGNRPLDL